LQNYFSHPSLVIHFFGTPTYKTETGTANRCGITNSKPPGPIIMMGQSGTLRSNFFFFLAKFRQDAKNNFFERIFYYRFLENLKKNRQKCRGFELVLPDLEALVLWVAKIKGGMQKKLYRFASPVPI
jgi:hypothetical protein